MRTEPRSYKAIDSRETRLFTNPSMAPSPISDPIPSPLPQYGFGPDLEFKTLVCNNRFLYRVYTPKERSPFADETDPCFVAPKFDELYARTPIEVTSASIFDPSNAAYSDVSKHMDWTTRSSSVYLSTSFSFAWSLWEALRRYHQGMKKDVEIAVIDAAALIGRAATAVEMLRKGSQEERGPQHSKWYKFSQESQSVLVYGFIPGDAVLSSIPLLSLLERLPSYLLRTKVQVIHGNPLDHVAWNYADKKQTYRQFCQEMSTRFFSTSQELRFRDATGGSLRLALTFLRPWFYRTILEDFDLAVTTLRDLAIIIAHWGGQWWARDHAELNRILDSMTFTLGEELLQRIQRQDMESSRLHDTVETLERIIRIHETERLIQPSQSLADSCQCASSPTTPQSSPKVRPRRTISMSVPIPYRLGGAQTFQSPITPPDSRRNSWVIPKESPTRQSLQTISFLPFTPPVDWPAQRSRSPPLSQLSSPMAPLPATPPTPTPISLPISIPEESNGVATESVEAPRTPVNSGRKDLDAYGSGDRASFPYLPTPPTEHEAPRTPIQTQTNSLELDGTVHHAQVISALPTPPLDFLEGLRARTLSDVSSGLRIFIPTAPTRLVFPPSPAGSIETTLESGSAHSSPRTLASPAPSSSATLNKTDSTLLEPSALGSPIRLIKSVDLDSLPPLPPSPSVSWGSAPTLPATPVTPSGSTQWPKSFGSYPLWGPLRRTLSDSSLTPVDPSPISTLSHSSLSEDAVKSPRSPISGHTSPAILSPREKGPPIGEEVRHIPPRVGVSILTVPIVPLERDDEEVYIEGDDSHKDRSRHGQILDTASTVVTGFLVGAFVTLFLVSTQRRTLLYLT